MQPPPESERASAWQRRVAAVIDALGLRDCTETLVGGGGGMRGISGGQRRRLTLARAFLSGARVIAVDGATTGLDAHRADDVVRLFCEWSRAAAATVVLSLESPSPEALVLFDAVVVLAEGRVLYHGPPGALQHYLAALGFPLPPLVDLADFVAEVGR